MLVRVVWFAFLASPLFFAFVLSQMKNTVPASEANPSSMLIPFAAVALVCLVLSRVLPNLLMEKSIRRFQGQPWTEATMRAETHKGQRIYKDEDIPKYLALEPEDQMMVRASGSYLTLKIMQLALCEASATLGFVYAQSSLSPQAYWPFGGAALIALAFSGPSVEHLRRFVADRNRIPRA